MDNIITSAIPPAAGLAVADKPVTGQIVEVPNLLNNIKVGDSILLQVMFDSDAFRLNTDLRVNLLVNNQKTPLRLHFDFCRRAASADGQNYCPAAVFNAVSACIH